MTLKARNADYTREYNRKTFLGILRKKPMSRAELARTTGLTRAATSLIVEDMVYQGLLAELPPQSVGRGRSAIPLAVKKDCYYALGVDLARKGCSVGLCDFGGSLLEGVTIGGPNTPLGEIVSALERIMKTVDPGKLLGVGVSAPGPLDQEQGKLLNPPRFDRWHGVCISRLLSEALGIPAYLEHDACALAQHQLQTGQSQNFMLLFVESGIGAAIMSDGQLLGNSRFFTGELGHTTIRFDGRQCECGNRGCLETYAGIPRLLEGTSFSSWQELVDRQEHDPEARRLLEQEATYLSAGMINLLNLIPVDTIYLSGEISYRPEKLAQLMLREIQTKALNRSKTDIHIYPSNPHPHVGIMAAAEVVFSRFLRV